MKNSSLSQAGTRSPAIASALEPPSILFCATLRREKLLPAAVAIPTRGASTPTASTSQSSWRSRRSTDATGSSARRQASTMASRWRGYGAAMHRPLRLTVDRSAIQSNWRWLARARRRVATGAAVKADGYGLGARETTDALLEVGCRDFFVSTWAEAEALGPLAAGRRASSCCTASGRTTSRRRCSYRARPCSTRSSRSRAGRKSLRAVPAT